MAYDGGKGGAGVYQTLINLMPPHRTYIEPFLGAGAVMRHKRPALASVGLDLDPAALALWTGAEVPGLSLVHGDALAFLRSYPFAGDELVYCDPPYVMDTRSCQRPLYRFEMTDGQHRELLAVLRALPCAVMLSGYHSPLYADALADWRPVTFQTVKRSGQLAQEWVWMNFAAPLELHDYGYLGAGFRERERIKRKRDRWKAKLLRMPDLERLAVLSAIQQLREPAPSPLAGNGEGGRS